MISRAYSCCFHGKLIGMSILAAALVGSACDGDADFRVTRLDVPSAGQSQSADPALGVAPLRAGLVLSWIAGDGKAWGLYTARSMDGGGTWSSPVRVAGGPDAPGEVHPHGESSPRLVVGPGERLALVWPNNVVVPGRKWPAAMLRFSRSEDGGQRWSPPITLNDDTAAAPVSHQFHGATWVGDSGIAVAWLDERNAAAPIAGGGDGHAEHAAEPDAMIYVATSPDFGRSWSPNRVGWKAACPCCRVTLARNPQGHAIAAWRQHFPGNVRDVVTAVLDGAPSPPQRVHQDDWSYPGCPHTGPAIASGADGAVHVVWYTGKPGTQGMYYVRSTRVGGPAKPVGLLTGSRMGPSHPAVAVLNDGGALAAYDLTAKGERKIGVARLRPDGRVAGRIWLDESDGGKYPQLAVVSDTAAVIAWTQPVGEGTQLRLARIEIR
jgi:hypothetical protein